MDKKTIFKVILVVLVLVLGLGFWAVRTYPQKNIGIKSEAIRDCIVSTEKSDTNGEREIGNGKTPEGEPVVYQQTRCSFTEEEFKPGLSFRVPIGHDKTYIFTYAPITNDEVGLAQNQMNNNWTYAPIDNPKDVRNLVIETKPYDEEEGGRYFSFRDLTFDGYLDVLSAPWMSTKRSGSDLYVYILKNASFDTIDDLDYYPADFVEVDSTNKTMHLSFYVGSVDFSERDLKFVDGLLILTHSVYSYGYGEERNGKVYCVTSIRTLVDGKYVESEQSEPKFEGDICFPLAD